MDMEIGSHAWLIHLALSSIASLGKCLLSSTRKTVRTLWEEHWFWALLFPLLHYRQMGEMGESDQFSFCANNQFCSLCELEWEQLQLSCQEARLSMSVDLLDSFHRRVLLNTISGYPPSLD